MKIKIKSEIEKLSPPFCELDTPSIVRSKGGGLNISYNLEKWKNSIFLCSMTSLNCSKREDMIL